MSPLDVLLEVLLELLLDVLFEVLLDVLLDVLLEVLLDVLPDEVFDELPDETFDEEDFFEEVEATLLEEVLPDADESVSISSSLSSCSPSETTLALPVLEMRLMLSIIPLTSELDM